ncbi:ABC transporter ATP-binding protein/permease [Plasticicumulans acidivorans]|uniref:Putative ATP-binding cassette transporter n=1 Tax=Plasticicumulans acidivorans TaxID=886464 RepID=A0A317MX37_9GAMM|nr:ABC transporter ATP-binding protein/permease [Plasticicumulans acidivorans]PWV63445.1 putative ATP-binding cassette transporter [Plasticicumulans acidivorans]
MRSWKAFLQAFITLAGAYYSHEETRWHARALTLVLVLLTVAQAAVPISVNGWSEYLFDALERRDLFTFLHALGYLLLIVGGSVVVMTAHLYIKRRLQIGWRAWLTSRLLNEWLDASCMPHVQRSPTDEDNPDGRIAEDARISCEYAVDLAHSALYCLLLLVSFTQILWGLSGALSIHLGSLNLPLPGHLVWFALIYGATGTAISLVLGRSLVRTANHRQRREADFRFGLVHTRQNTLSIALRQCEPDERRRLWALFSVVLQAWEKQSDALRSLFFFSSGWSTLSQTVPFLVAAPRYIAGTITLGTLMQTAQAFQQMIGALAWPIDNMPKLAEWRASVERVLGLHQSLQHSERPSPAAPGKGIELALGETPALSLNGLTIEQPNGQVLLEDVHTQIQPGDRVLISGDPATAVKLFRVVGGLWPWGRGRVELPEGSSIFFMPRRPYLPTATLRDVIACPPQAEAVDDATIRQALQTVGLSRLTPLLGRRGEWEQDLDAGDKQRIGFARLLLQRPHWIFINNAIDALDPAGKAQMLALLREQFPQATIVTIGENGLLSDFHGRRLTITRAGDRAHVIEQPIAAAPISPERHE